MVSIPNEPLRAEKREHDRKISRKKEIEREQRKISLTPLTYLEWKAKNKERAELISESSPPLPPSTLRVNIQMIMENYLKEVVQA